MDNDKPVPEALVVSTRQSVQDLHTIATQIVRVRGDYLKGCKLVPVMFIERLAQSCQQLEVCLGNLIANEEGDEDDHSADSFDT